MIKTYLNIIDRKTGEVLEKKDMGEKTTEQIIRIASGMSINMNNKRYKIEIETTVVPE